MVILNRPDTRKIPVNPVPSERELPDSSHGASLPSMIAAVRECSHQVKFFEPLRQGHPPGYYRTARNFRKEKFAGIYHHVFEPKMPPSEFLGVTHDKTPRRPLPSSREV
jgi:hypothetical protein